MTAFTEKQRLGGWWIWGLVGVCYLIAGSAFLIGPSSTGWIALLIVSCLTLAFWGRQLDTRFDEVGAHVRLSLVADWHTIRWSDMAEYTLTTYPDLALNIRWYSDEWLYTMGDTWGLRINTTTGRRITIGTQRPEELRAFLQQLAALSA